ncbi:MAG: VOC family protein [Planctomycetales bacterium]
MRVLHLDHVTLVVRDLEASRRFYVDLLGMTEVARPAFSFDGKWFQAGATQIHLILEHAESGPGGEQSPRAKIRSRAHHFAFEVEDGRAFAEFLRQKAAPIIAGPKDRPDGAVQVFLEDPDGYVVELYSRPGAS